MSANKGRARLAEASGVREDYSLLVFGTTKIIKVTKKKAWSLAKTPRSQRDF
jgi:hypothetical protein